MPEKQPGRISINMEFSGLLSKTLLYLQRFSATCKNNFRESAKMHAFLN